MFDGRFNKIILILIYITIFISSWVLMKRPVEIYIGYLLFIPLLPLFIIKFGLPKWTIIFFFFILFGFFNIFTGNNTFELFIKIFLGLFLSYLFYYYVMVIYNFQAETLFKYYLKGAYIVSIIGLVQFLSYQVGFSPGYDYGWLLNKWGVITGGNFGIRINSVFPEPTHYAAFMSSAFFIAVYDLAITRNTYYYSKIQSIIVILVYFFTFSGVGYTGIIFTIVIFLLNYGLIRYMLLAIPIIIVAFNFMYNNVLEFRFRIDSTVEIFSTGTFEINRTHGSAIILYNNYHITLENFKSNFLFGGGLGSHPIASEKYSLTKHIETYGFQLNYADANSMFLRMISETGLFGTIIFLWILFKCYIRRPADNKPGHHWLISNALFVLILLNLSRQGHYFLNGFPFYVWLYIYNYWDYKKLYSSESEKPEKELNVSG